MNVSIVGSCYVGTTVAACFVDYGHEVTNIDIEEDIVAATNEDEAPIHEPELNDLVAEYGGDRLKATSDYTAVREMEVTFLALPIPSREDAVSTSTSWKRVCVRSARPSPRKTTHIWSSSS